MILGLSVWEIGARLGVPGLALIVFLYLLSPFKFRLPTLSKRWSGPLALVFLILVAIVISLALYLWAPAEKGSNTPPPPQTQPSTDPSVTEPHPIPDVSPPAPWTEPEMTRYGQTELAEYFVDVAHASAPVQFSATLDRLDYYRRNQAWRPVTDWIDSWVDGVHTYAAVDTKMVVADRKSDTPFGLYKLNFDVTVRGLVWQSSKWFNYTFKPDFMLRKGLLAPDNNRAFETLGGESISISNPAVGSRGYHAGHVQQAFDFKTRFVISGAFRVHPGNETDPPSLWISCCNRWPSGQLETAKFSPILSFFIPDSVVRTNGRRQERYKIQNGDGDDPDAWYKQVNPIIDVARGDTSYFLIYVRPSVDFTGQTDCLLYVSRKQPAIGVDTPIFSRTFAKIDLTQPSTWVRLAIYKSGAIDLLDFEVAEFWPNEERELATRAATQQGGG